MQKIIISNLPLSIQNQIPYSIKSYKDEYNLSELPHTLQYIIKSYLERQVTVDYKRIYDFKPIISEYNDFKVIDSISDLIKEYLKVIFQVEPGSYPFEPSFGSQLKRYIHKMDTSVQKMLINNEVNNIINFISRDLDILISVKDVSLKKINTMDLHVEYNINMTINTGNSEYFLSIEA